jgi:SmpA / OmlA family
MMNDGNTAARCAPSSTLWFRPAFAKLRLDRHSFVIRHLSFVISHASRLLLVLVLVLGVSCTPSKRITKANVDAVEQGMSKKQVESILGTPTSITNEQTMKQTTYVYQQGQDSVTIVFIDDKVQSKESTLSN